MAAALPDLLITVRILTCKGSPLMTCKISRLVPNTLSADGKYSLLNRDNLTQPIQMQVSQIQKTFSEFFFHFRNVVQILDILKRRWPSLLMYFRNYVLQKTWLDQCLKSPISEDPSKSNIVNATKHCWNLNDKNFTRFIDQYPGNWPTKGLC